jgi:hypothetical protein
VAAEVLAFTEAGVCLRDPGVSAYGGLTAHRETAMSELVVYRDTSEVRPGMLDALKPALRELAAFIESNEPRLLAYNIYFDAAAQRMTVMHVHPDAASLAAHLRNGGHAFARFVPLVRLLSIDIYGDIDEPLLEQLREKARLLGEGVVRANGHHAGFSRFLVK